MLWSSPAVSVGKTEVDILPLFFVSGTKKAQPKKAIQSESESTFSETVILRR